MRMFLSRIRSLVRRDALESRLDDEVHAHLQMLAAEYERGGMTPADARHAARRAFGGAEPMKERYRDRRGLPWVDDLGRDVRYGIRALRRHPGLTATAVLTLALGIGANTALFTVIDAVMLRPLPVDDPQDLRVIAVMGSDPARPVFSFSQPVYADFRDRVTEFSGVLAFGGGSRMGMTFSGGAASAIEPIQTQPVSGGFFSVLGVRPAAGRLLDAGDDRPDAEPAAVLSDAYWAGRFGRDPSIIGRSMIVNGVSFTVVGVAPQGFSGVEVGAAPDMWWPLQAFPRVSGLPAELFNSRMFRSWRVMGRLRPGASEAQAQAQADAVFLLDRADMIARRTAQAGGALAAAERARLDEGRLTLEPARAGYTPLRWQFRRPLVVLMVVVALVLLVACVNVANLLLARAAARSRELAVRLSLGSGRARLVRQLLVESVLLALAGGLCGIGVAMVGSRFVAAFLQSQQVTVPVSPDLRVLGFTLAVSLLAAFVAGLIPAVAATRLDLVNRDARGRVGQGRLRTHHALVAAQMALSIVVVVVAGLFLKTLTNLQGVALGVERDNLTTASLDMPPGAEPERRLVQLRDLLARANATPGSRAALSMFGMMSGGGWTDRIVVPGYLPRVDEDPAVFRVLVSGSFFDVTGMRVIAGRPFGPVDDESPTRAAIVNETLARQYFQGRAVGRQLSISAQAPGELLEVVGVVADSIYRNVRDEADAPRPTVYLPALQGPGAAAAGQMGRVQLQMRTTRTAGVESDVREIARQVDPGVLVSDVRSMREIVDDTIARERLLADLAGWLGAIALLLGAIGIYGVRSYAVNRRVGDFGVRLALGATPGQVAGHVVAEGAAVGGLGIGAGLIAAAAVTRFVEGLLFGVTPLDAPTFGAAAALFVAIAIAASYLPARRAGRIDPLVALRSE